MASGSAGSGWHGVYLVLIFHVRLTFSSLRQLSWSLPALALPTPPGVLAGLSNLLDHLSETELLDPSPALLLLCGPHSASWEHSPLLSAVQAKGFLDASTLSCLTYHQPAWQCCDMCKGVLQSHYLGLNPSSSECEPCDTDQITLSCLDFLTCTKGFKIPLIFIRLPSSDFGCCSTELLK